MNRREVLGGGLALSASALTPLPAFAQAKYPERPIRLIVPFSAGGVVDAVARQWAERIKPHLGTIVVENEGGAGGTIGMYDVARAKPDGYTVGALQHQHHGDQSGDHAEGASTIRPRTSSRSRSSRSRRAASS